MKTDPILLTAKLIEHRNDMRRLLGDRYADTVRDARAVIRGLAKERGQSLAKVTLWLSQRCDAAGRDPSEIFSAFVDETEAQSREPRRKP